MSLLRRYPDIIRKIEPAHFLPPERCTRKGSHREQSLAEVGIKIRIVSLSIKGERMVILTQDDARSLCAQLSNLMQEMNPPLPGVEGRK